MIFDVIDTRPCTPLESGSLVLDVLAAVDIAACLKPGEVHPGPCKGGGTAVKKATRAVAKKKTPAKAPRPQTEGRVVGRDLTAEVDFGALAQLPAKIRRGEPDQRLAAVASMQGFDGKPQLGSSRDLDALVDAGGYELFRGTQDSGRVTSAQHAQQFRTGDAFYGTGDYGNGIYFTPSQEEALGYADFDEDGVNRAVMPRDAKIIDLPELKTQARMAAPEAVDRMQTAQQQLLDSLTDEQERIGALNAALEVNAAERVRSLAADTSLHAMAKGYDAIRIPGAGEDGEDYWIVLNRTALTVQDRADGRFTVQPGELVLPLSDAARLRQWAFQAGLLTHVAGCRPPHVPVPRPGPCPKKKTGDSTAKRATRKATSKGRSRLDVGTKLDYPALVGKLKDRSKGDQAMAEIARRQGFDKVPARGTPQDLDRARKAGGVEVWRGQVGYGDVSAREAMRRFLDGPAEYNPGVFGSGWSATTDPAPLDDAGISATRLVLPADTSIVDLDELVARQKTQRTTAFRQQRKLFRALDAANGATAREAALRALQDWTARQPDRDRIFNDPGRFAAALGHEAIRVRRPNQPDRYVILNRGKVLAEDTPRPGSVTAGAAADECREELCRYPRHPGPCKKPGSRDRRRKSGGVGGVSIKKVKLPKPRLKINIRPAVGNAADNALTALLLDDVAVSACMPPKVPVPKPGPCPGAGRGGKKAVAKAVKKAVTPKSRPAVTAGPGIGKDVSAMLNMESIAALPKRDPIGNDLRLVAIAQQQGFDAPAMLASKSEIDAAVAAGGRELWRGVKPRAAMSTAQIHEQGSLGPAFFGQGIYGNGIYYSNDRVIANNYTLFNQDPAAIQRAVLPSGARTISYPELLEQMAADQTTSTQEYQERGRLLLEDLAQARDITDYRIAWEMYQGHPQRIAAADLLRTDPGAWAMSRGYDAFVVPVVAGDLDEVVVLNRGALMVQDDRGQVST